jgi:hypothetical protein
MTLRWLLSENKMNRYLYDAVTNAFYPFASKAIYLEAGSWPANGVDVDEETYEEFKNPPTGKMRVPDSEGNPSWVDIPPAPMQIYEKRLFLCVKQYLSG